MERAYIRLFGVVDLPTRIRARAVCVPLNDHTWDSVLDVGAGTGVYAYYASRQPGRRVVAVDVDGRRVESIRRIAARLGRGGLIAVRGDENDIRSLPGEFALVLAVEVLQYFPELQTGLRSLQACLRPGGMLVAHVPVRSALWPHERALFDDDAIRAQWMSAGFEPPEIRHTFGRVSCALCAIFEWCTPHPVLLAITYPLLLFASAFTSAIVKHGKHRLVVARKPANEALSSE